MISAGRGCPSKWKQELKRNPAHDWTLRHKYSVPARNATEERKYQKGICTCPDPAGFAFARSSAFAWPIWQCSAQCVIFRDVWTMGIVSYLRDAPYAVDRQNFHVGERAGRGCFGRKRFIGDDVCPTVLYCTFQSFIPDRSWLFSILLAADDSASARME